MPFFRVKDDKGNTYDVPALKGEPGYTPVQGVDYLTEEELTALDDRFYNRLAGRLTAEDVGARPDTWVPTAADVGAAPASHASNRNNPHGVTAEQVGARPNNWMPTASEVGARPDNWMPPVPTAEEVGARPNTWMPTAEQVGARPNNWMPTAAQVGARPDTWIPTAAQVGARPDTWMPTASEIGAAPAGYGLGATYPQTIMSAGELDACRTCGFYCAVYGGTICGIYFDYADLIVYPIYGNECVQELRPVNTNYCLRRFWYADSWSEWEQVGAVMKVLWMNDRPTEEFPGKTISPPGLSNYQAIYVQCVRSTDDQTLSGSALVWLDKAPAYLMGTTDQYGATRRKVTATKTGITFSGFSSEITSDGSTNEIPMMIFGINGIGM